MSLDSESDSRARKTKSRQNRNSGFTGLARIGRPAELCLLVAGGTTGTVAAASAVTATPTWPATATAFAATPTGPAAATTVAATPKLFTDFFQLGLVNHPILVGVEAFQKSLRPLGQFVLGDFAVFVLVEFFESVDKTGTTTTTAAAGTTATWSAKSAAITATATKAATASESAATAEATPTAKVGTHFVASQFAVFVLV